MAVGGNFYSPETQAAIQKQSGQVPADESTPQEGIDATAKQTEADASQQKQVADNENGAKVDIKVEVPEDADAEGTEKKIDVEEPAKVVKLPDMTQETVDKALDEAGYTPEDLGKALAENQGKFPEDLLKDLKTKFDAEQVDAQVKATEDEFKAKVKARETSVNGMNTYIFETLAGGDAAQGEVKFKELASWCLENMPAEEIAVVNTLIKSTDKSVVKSGLEKAVNAWRKGSEQAMMTGDAEAKVVEKDAEKFVGLSKDEFIKIMTSDKYQEDPEYAAKIDAQRRDTIAKLGVGATTPEYSTMRPPI